MGAPTRTGAEDLRALNDDADQGEAIRAVVEGAILALIWGVLLVVMIAIGRMVATRREWPLDLPRDPKAWLMAVHFTPNAALGVVVCYYAWDWPSTT